MAGTARNPQELHGFSAGGCPVIDGHIGKSCIGIVSELLHRIRLRMHERVSEDEQREHLS
jgi:hypothetical protein